MTLIFQPITLNTIFRNTILYKRLHFLVILHISAEIIVLNTFKATLCPYKDDEIEFVPMLPGQVCACAIFCIFNLSIELITPLPEFRKPIVRVSNISDPNETPTNSASHSGPR